MIKFSRPTVKLTVFYGCSCRGDRGIWSSNSEASQKRAKFRWDRKRSKSRPVSTAYTWSVNSKRIMSTCPPASSTPLLIAPSLIHINHNCYIYVLTFVPMPQVADPKNRICDAPGSWYCVGPRRIRRTQKSIWGQYPPALEKSPPPFICRCYI